jgi:hypothetical protein
MKESYSECLSTSFVIRSNEIESLTKLFEDNVGSVKASIKCVDGISREFASVSELLKYENPRSKEICELRLIARSNDWSKEASITFSSSKSRGITMEYRADSDSVYKLKTGTLDIVDGTRHWYGYFQSIDFVFFGFAILLIFCTFALLQAAFSKITSIETSGSPKFNSKESAIGQLLVLGIATAVVGLGFFLNLIRDSWFPFAVFAIGQGSDRFQGLERFHWNCVVAILLLVAISIVMNISRFIWGKSMQKGQHN